MKKRTLHLSYAIIALLIITRLNAFQGESGYFTIDTKLPVVSVNSPNGGENFPDAQEIPVTWQATDETLGNNPISAAFSVVQDGEFQITETNIANDGAEMVTLPYANTNYGKVRIIATDAFGNQGYDESDGYFSFSRIGGSGFDVTVTAEYDGNPHPDVIGRFISGIEAVNTFTAQVNTPPGTGTIARVEFTLDGTIYTDNTISDGWTLEYNMGLLSDNVTLSVQAFDVSGFASAIRTYTIDIIAIPVWITNLGYDYLPEFDNGNYLIDITFPADDAFNFQSSIPDNVLFMGGLQNNLDAHMSLEFGAGIDGTAVIGGGGSISGNIMASANNAPNLNGSIDVLASINPDWSLNQINAVGNASLGFPIPEVGTSWTVYPYGIPITISLDLGGEVTCGVDMAAVMNDSLEFLQGTEITPGLEVAVDATASISLVYGVAKLSMIAHPTAVIEITIYYTTADGSSHSWSGSFVVPYELVGSLGWGLYSGLIYEGQLPAGGEPWTFGDQTRIQSRMNRLLSRRTSILNNLPDVMPTPSLAMNSTGQGMLVWLKDTDPVDNSPNPEIYYSLWDGVFSGGTAVTSNNYFETDPTIEYLPNGNVLLAWTHNKTLQTETPLIQDLLANQEIYYSIWDTTSQTWSAPSAITDNGLADGVSSLSIKNDTTAIAAWTHITTSVNSHSPGDWEINFSTWNGTSWSNPQSITDNNSADLDVDITYLSGGNAMAVWLYDNDTDFSTISDMELKYAIWDGTTWNTPVTITSNDYQESSPKLAATSDGDAYLTWTSGEMQIDSTTIDRIYISRWDHTTQLWAAPQIVYSDSQFVETPDLTVSTINSVENLAITWRGYDGYDGDLFASFHAVDEPLNTWTTPAQVTADSLTDWMITSGIDANANAVFVNMKTDFSDTTSQMFNRGNYFDGLNVMAKGINSAREMNDELNFGLLEVKPDLRIKDSQIQFYHHELEVDYAAVNDTIAINSVIENSGVVEADTFDVSLYLGHPDSSSTSIIQTVNIPGLKPDSSFALAAEWVVNAGGSHEIFIRIDPANAIAEQRELNNTESNILHVLPDVVAGSLSYSVEGIKTGDTLAVTAIVSNNGHADAYGIDYSMSYDDSIYAALAGTIDTLLIGETDTLLIRPIALSGSREFIVVFDADSSTAELHEDNNLASVTIEILPDYKILPEDISVVADTGEVYLITASVINIGAMDGVSIPVLVFEGNPNQSGVLLDSIVIDSLPAGGVYLVVTPWTPTIGEHEIHIRVNEDLAQVEYSYDNNFAFDNFLINNRPDLVISEGDLIVSGGNPMVGDTNTIQLTVHNTGGSDGLNVTVNVYDSYPVDSLTTTFLDTIIPLISASDSVVLETSWFVPDSVYGIVPFWAIVDANNDIHESEETTNNLMVEISFYPEIAVTPDSIAVEIGIDSLMQGVVITNSGNANMSVVLDTTAIPAWLLVSNDSLLIPPLGSDTVTVTFYPTNLTYGHYNYEISILSNDIDTPVDTIPVLMTIPGIAPVVDSIPDFEFPEDSASTLLLDDYVSDEDDPDSLLTWTVHYLSGSDSLMPIIIVDRQAHFNPIEDWNGVSHIVFEARDPFDLIDTDTITVTVLPVNDSPMLVNPLLDVTIPEDDFGAIIIPRLEDYFDDVDLNDNLLFSGLALDPGLDSLKISTPDQINLAGWFGSQNDIISIKRSSKKTDVIALKKTIFTLRRKTDRKEIVRPIPSAVFSNPSVEVLTLDRDTDSDTTSVIIYPSENFNGYIRILITASDGSPAFVEDTMLVSIIAVNDPPIIAAIPDTSIMEDDTLSVQLLFSDLDGDSLTLNVASDTAAVQGTISDSILIIIPDENWNGTANLTISVADNDTIVTAGFLLTVFPINDAPGEFSLINPDGDSTWIEITAENLSDSLVFMWQHSTDADEDTITYTAELTDGLVVLDFDEITETTTSFQYNDLYSIINESGSTTISGTWTVLASDGILTTIADNGPFYLEIDISLVNIADEINLPTEFALHQNYPNPFNPVTTIKYDLPEDVMVTMLIYDIMGRQVNMLVNEYQQAGFQSIQWDGRDTFGRLLGTGMYFYYIKAGSYSKVRKMVLLK